MSKEPPRERSAYETARSWLDQRKTKQANGTSSFAPHTPPAQRSISTFSSPGSMLGKEEDAVIIELTPRYLLAGIEGETGPQCRIFFGPQGNGRVGDYRVWLPEYKRKQEHLGTWGRHYELWKNDIKSFDAGLFSDVLERTVREVYNKHLLVDAGLSRLVLVIPSLVPHPVLETMLTTLFQRWKYSSITLLPTPTMSVIAAGVRSALVIDIGWEETVVTAVYEYREICCRRSIRALKALSLKIAAVLKQIKDDHKQGQFLRFDLEFVDEFVFKVFAIMDRLNPSIATADGDKSASTATSKNDESTLEISDIEIEWPAQTTSHQIRIPRQQMLSTVLETMLGGQNDEFADDDETHIPQLVYDALLSLPPDARGTCMSRIMFIGRGAQSTLLRNEILKNVSTLVEINGWAAVRGQHVNTERLGSHNVALGRSEPVDAKHNIQSLPDKDHIGEQIQKQKAHLVQADMQGVLRELHTLGPWSGASLLTSLKIRGFVEIERDRFLSHGLAGASRDSDISVAPQQRMSSFGFSNANKSGDRNSWTLAGWG